MKDGKYIKDYSGRFLVIVSPEEHRVFVQSARERNFKTLNAFMRHIAQTLAKSLDKTKPPSPTAAPIQKTPYYENPEYMHRVNITGTDEEMHERNRKNGEVSEEEIEEMKELYE